MTYGREEKLLCRKTPKQVFVNEFNFPGLIDLPGNGLGFF